MKIAYLHGLESSIDEKDPKIIFLRNNFSEVYAPSIAYRNDNTFDNLFADIKRLKPDLIVGSSMGGYVSYIIGSKLGVETVLFNPAVETRTFNPVVDESGMKKSKHNVYLGKSDNVVSGKEVRSYFKKHAIGNFKYRAYDGGHRVPESTFINAIKLVLNIEEKQQNEMKHIKLYEDFASDNQDLERIRNFSGKLEDIHTWLSRKLKDQGLDGETNPYKDTIMANGPQMGKKDKSMPYQDFQNGESDLVKNRHGR
jgi:hypothetical protein